MLPLYFQAPPIIVNINNTTCNNDGTPHPRMSLNSPLIIAMKNWYTTNLRTGMASFRFMTAQCSSVAIYRTAETWGYLLPLALDQVPSVPSDLIAINRTPAEVWGRIFEFACVDGGTTGRSLALVSKYFYTISRLYRLQSVSVQGPEELQLFLRLLKQTPPHQRRVRSLFISTQRRGGEDAKRCWEFLQDRLSGTVHQKYLRTFHEMLKLAPKNATWLWAPRLGMLSQECQCVLFSNANAWLKVTARHAPMMADAIDAILEMAAPDLEVLELDVKPLYRRFLQGVTNFPRLRELTHHGRYPLHQINPCHSLRYLHLRNQFGYHESIAHMARFAPNLTHLLLSDLRNSERLCWSDAPVTTPANLEGPSHPAINLSPPTIERVFVRHAHSWYRDYPPEGLDGWDDRITLLPEQDENFDMNWFFCWPSSESDWLDRISGGTGCWPSEKFVTRHRTHGLSIS